MKPILCSLMLVIAASCSDSSADLAAPPPPGVTFSYPSDGQDDIPTEARLIFQFTEEVNADVVAAPCELLDGVARGGFCVVGDDGLVPVTTTVQGPSNNLVVATAGALRPGQRYQIFVRPTVLPSADNLRDDAPLVTFRTRNLGPAPGAPQLVSVSGEDPRAFAVDGPALEHPILTSTTLRLVFSEAIDPGAQLATQRAQLRRVDVPADVPVAVLIQGPHLIVDPTDDLDDGGRYELTLTGLQDRGGTPLPTTTLTFSPRRAATYDQVVELDQPGSASGPVEARSVLTGAPINSVEKHSDLIGTAELGLLPGSLRVELGDPTAFDGPIPFTLRKGQRLSASEIALKLAGVIGLGYQTGALSFELVTDGNGWVQRNGYRGKDQRPDDHAAPLHLELFFDAALTAEDPTGNALATQTILNVHLVGTATSAGGQLVLEAAGALEIELLGVTRATADLSLRMRTGGEAPLAPAPPRLVSVSPTPGETEVSIDVHPQLLLSKGIDVSRAATDVAVTLRSPTQAIASTIVQAGGALVLVPAQPLLPATTYTVIMGELFDVGAQPLVRDPGDPTGGTGSFSFTTAPVGGGDVVPPQLASLVPGVPCALTGGNAASPGRCASGNGGDLPYQPFQLTADRAIEAQFTQRMAPASLQLGIACGRGALRVEELNSAGACVRPVPGELTVRPRSFRFAPATPWTAGGKYRVVLVSGGNGSCGADELCGANGQPLNPDPLGGVGDAGGPDIVIPFTAAVADTTTGIPLATARVSDRNANGRIDTGETRQLSNEFAIEVAGTSGIVTAASLAGPDCQPALPGNQVCVGITADLPITVLPTLASCPVDATGAEAMGAGPCVPVRISAQDLRTTSLTIDATASVLGQTLDLRNVQTGMMHLRVLEPQAAGAVGYILNDAEGTPVFVITASTLMDAPDLSILAGLVSHDVRSKAVSLTLGGPVTFLADGRMQVVLHNLGAVIIPVNLSTAVGLDGRINLRVPDGTLTLSLSTPPLH